MVLPQMPLEVATHFVRHDMQLTQKKPRHRTLAAAALLLATACVSSMGATFGDDASAREGIAIETNDSRNARVALVHTRTIDSQVAVTGYIEKKHLQRGMIPGRLLLTVIGHDGNVLQEVSGNYHRRSLHSKRAYFSEMLDVDARDVSAVRVTHLGIGE